MSEQNTFDFIIVGAGSAGYILANRLSECEKFSVLLLEVSGDNTSLWIKMSAGFAKKNITALNTTIVSSNINAATMMNAEKGLAHIIQEHKQ